MPVFTDVPEFVTNELLTVDKMNIYVSDNLEAIRDPAYGVVRWQNDGGGTNTLNVTGSGWLPLAEFTQTLTTSGKPVYLHFMGNAFVGPSSSLFFLFTIDGIGLSLRTFGNGRLTNGANNLLAPVHFSAWAEDLEAGEHIFGVSAFKINAASGLYEQGQFIVREMS